MKVDGRIVADATGGRLLMDGAPGVVATDTRALPPGCWFVALVGPRFDAHTFLTPDLDVAGAVAERLPDGWSRGLVLVPDTTRALQDLGRWARDQVRGPVVGLTGSAGKTTTRALTALALGGLGRVHQTVGNLNNQLGVPMTLLATPEDAAAVVVELGTSSPGEIAFLAELARPDVRIVVNVGPAHLQELGGLAGVAREKGALFETARPGDTLIANADDPFVRGMPRPVRALTWGRFADADVRLLEAVVDPATLHTRGRFATPSGEVEVELRVPGEHVVHDAGAALATALALGLDLRDAAARLGAYEPVGMRMRREALPGGAVALNDAYNANPTSMVAALEVLAHLPGRRVAVLGDMLELGEDEALWHERVAARAGELGLDLVVLVGPRMAPSAGACAGEVWARPSPDGVAADLAAWLRPGDHVLFKGSRGARMERILQELQGAPPVDPPPRGP